MSKQKIKPVPKCKHDNLLLEKFSNTEQRILKEKGVFPVRCENCKAHMYAFDPKNLL